MILSSFNLMATCTLGPNITTYYIVGLKLENIATTNVIESKKGYTNLKFLMHSLNIEYSYCTGTSTVYIQYICLSMYVHSNLDIMNLGIVNFTI